MPQTQANFLPYLKNGVAQVAVLVPKLEIAVENYWKLFGIGPWHFYTYANPLLKTQSYRGQPSDYKIRIALAWFGPVRIELIEALEGDSIFKEYIEKHGYGFHHIGVLVEEMQTAISEAENLGLSMIQDGAGFGLDGDGHFAFLDTEEKLGVTVEFIERPKGRVTPEKIYPAEAA